MGRRIALTAVVSSILVVSWGTVALGAANEGASCVGIGASVTASSGQRVPDVIAAARMLLGTQGIGGFASPAAQQHAGTVEACFPELGTP